MAIIEETMRNKICYICGKATGITKHHLKTRDIIPLCRKCHDEVEEAKIYINSMKSRKAAYTLGFKQAMKETKKKTKEELKAGKNNNKKFDEILKALKKFKRRGSNYYCKNGVLHAEKVYHDFALDELIDDVKEIIGDGR